MRNSSLFVLELIWWATCVASIAAAIRLAFTEGGMKTLIFILMAAISFLFAWLRHQQRKKS